MSYPKVIKKDTLEVGDVVSWRGSWGSSGSKDAVVTRIQSNFSNGSKDGVEVDKIDWEHVVERNVIVDIDICREPNRSYWAWAYQIKQKYEMHHNKNTIFWVDKKATDDCFPHLDQMWNLKEGEDNE